MNLDALDQKLWVALACPTNGLEIDARTLALIDTDKDGRVRAASSSPREVRRPQPEEPRRSAEGRCRRCRWTPSTTRRPRARRCSRRRGRSWPTSASPTPPRSASRTSPIPARIFAETAFNGDGVITEMSPADEPRARSSARSSTASARAGSVRQARASSGEGSDAFFAEARAYDAWHAKAEQTPRPTCFRWAREDGGRGRRHHRRQARRWTTTSAAAAWPPSIRAPLQSLNRNEEEYLAIAAKDLSITADEIAGFPLAQVAASRPLPLAGPVNPAHAAALRRCADDAVAPLLGPRDALTEADWLRSARKLAPYEAWLAAKPGQRVEKLGDARIREILFRRCRDACAALRREGQGAGGGSHQHRAGRTAGALPPRSRAALHATSSASRTSTTAASPAIFQCGTLYLDQRACRLCLRVDDAGQARHHGRAGRRLSRLSRLHAQGDRREDADRRRVHRRRQRQPDGRAQRPLLRPPGARLGRHHHQDRRQPDQHSPGVLVAVQEVRAAARGAGRQARRRRRRRVARQR